jgi:hypothetical protein
MAETVSFIESVAFPAAPAVFREAETAAIAASFKGGRQALVVDSQLAEFNTTVPSAVRPAISYGLLLGQLATDKALAGVTDPMKWFTTYNDVMGKIGWLSTGAEFSEQKISGVNVELHKAIIPVLAAVLGPAAAASSIIIAALKGLESMNQKSPWITLFQERSATVKGAKFATSFVDAGEGGGALLKTVFFGFEANQAFTQILFLKISNSGAAVRGARSEMQLGAQVIKDTGDALAKKVAPFIVENIKNIDI